MICPQCGAQNSPGRHFCYVCAAPLTQAAAGSGDAPRPSPQQRPTPQHDPPPAPAPDRAPPYAPPHYSQPERRTAAPPAQRPTDSGAAPLVWIGSALLVITLVAFALWQVLTSTQGLVGEPTAPPSAGAPTPASKSAAQPGQSTTNPTTPAPVARPTLAPPARVRGGDQLQVPRAARPPLVDGSLQGDWAGEGYLVGYPVFGPENHSGPDDLSGRLWFAWDDRAFYLAALVIDDIVSQPSRGAALYQGDSVEIQWDLDLEGDFDVNEFNADDWHIGLSPGNFRDQPPEAYIWTPRAQPGFAVGVQVAGRTFSTSDGRKGYTLEATIPWQLVNVVPRPGQAFGFSFCISDNDLPTPAQQSMLCTSPNREWHRPATFNTLFLAP